MLFAKVFYFTIYAAFASFLPFLTLYYADLGLSGTQIGLLASIPSLINFGSAPLFGALADKSQKHNLILRAAIILTAVGIFGLTLAKTFFPLLLIVIVYAFFFAPIIPIVDNTVLEALGDRQDEYGKQRLWGAVGWGISGPIAGWLVDQGGILWAFYTAVILFGLLFALVRTFPARKMMLNQPTWQGIRLLRNPRIALFLFIAFLGGIGLSSIHNYFFLFLETLGASPTLMGISLTIATSSELVVMYFTSRLMRKWGTRNLLMAGLFTLSVRLFAYTIIANPGTALAFQLLHGPTFAILWVAGVAYTNQIAPKGMETTTQGFYSGTMALGSAAGGFLGGILYQGSGFKVLYGSISVVLMLALVVFYILENRLQKKYAKKPVLHHL